MRKLTGARKLTLGAMVTALTVLFLYLASVLPTMRLACFFLSAIFIFALSDEGAYVFAILSFLATSAISFLLLPNKLVLLPYMALLGHYGIVKRAVDLNVERAPLRILLKLLYCNVFTALGVVFALKVLSLDVLSMLPDVSIVLLVLAAEVGFVLFELLYTVLSRFYENRIRDLILPRR